jgi:hypothetical protein
MVVVVFKSVKLKTFSSGSKSGFRKTLRMDSRSYEFRSWTTSSDSVTLWFCGSMYWEAIVLSTLVAACSGYGYYLDSRGEV